jgi:hypothetical protein
VKLMVVVNESVEDPPENPSVWMVRPDAEYPNSESRYKLAWFCRRMKKMFGYELFVSDSS